MFVGGAGRGFAGGGTLLSVRLNLFRFIALVRAYRNSVLPKVSHCIICIG